MKIKTLNNYIIFSEKGSPGSFSISSSDIEGVQRVSAIGYGDKKGSCVINGERYYLGEKAALDKWLFVYLEDYPLCNWFVETGLIPVEKARIA